MEDPEATSSGAWPRAAALLARSSLEASMTELWQTKEIPLQRASWRAQLLCLPGYIDPDLARRVAFAHSALSAACHHHPYDLPPTAIEIQRWLGIIQDLIAETWEVADERDLSETANSWDAPHYPPARCTCTEA